MLPRSYRKYLRVATDSEEVLAFLLGELVKDRSRYLTLKNAGKQPASVSIKITDFEARVSRVFCFSPPKMFTDSSCTISQAKELEVFDVQAFLGSRLFKNNGYSRREGEIVKSFSDEL